MRIIKIAQILFLVGTILLSGGCSHSEHNGFYYSTNYRSETPAGDSVFIAGTKTDPGIKSKGWALYQSVSGAWGFSVGDGKTGFLYQPTPERQSVADGGEHELAFLIDTAIMEIRWWYDQKNVAIYNIKGLNLIESGLQNHATVEHRASTPLSHRSLSEVVPERSRRVEVSSIKLLAWNIWHGGRETGTTEGVARVVDIIQQSGADIICMVETYGSGPIIADSLGYYFYLRSSNLSIMSRFPIGKTIDMFRPFNYGGAEIHLAENQMIRVHPLWIHYLPDMNNLKKDEIPNDSLLAWEWKTRGTEIRGILDLMKSELEQSDDIPVIMAGDYNSASHIDWTHETRDLHRGRSIEWPVSKQMDNAGLNDAYRMIYPDVRTHLGHTWSPVFKGAWQDRIDYVYFKGTKISPVNAKVIDTYKDRFPSDHAAVLVEFEWLN